MSSGSNGVEGEGHEGGLQKNKKERKGLSHVVIRFAGDSGDGMQLTGTQFTKTSAVLGNDISTLPDYPAEIRAPAGSLAGVSGYQIHFSSSEIFTPGDAPNVLVAMNPAALRTNLADLENNGMLILNSDSFTEDNIKLAGYKSNPITDGVLKGYRLFEAPITTLTHKAMEGSTLSRKEISRCKNFFALGLMYWMFDRPLDVTLKWIREKFGKNRDIAMANEKAMMAGYHYGETTEIFDVHYQVPAARLLPGKYRHMTGNEATALGLVAAASLAKKELFYASYPITPASDILHELSKLKNFGVKCFQAEDEISAMGAAIGSAFAGGFAVTGTSGPGLCLKSEAINLAVMTELPVVILDIQRGGPSTGLPTKTEQGDLLQALFGRNGESPLPIVAPATPGECFDMAYEAFRIAIKYMTPVIYLSDGYLANGAEPWLIPDLQKIRPIVVNHWKEKEGFFPYLRNKETLARPWAIPGTVGLEHRIGGLEKADITGNVSYDALNHEKMVQLRGEKIARIADDIPLLSVNGVDKKDFRSNDGGELLILGWGETYGAIRVAVHELKKSGYSVSSAHLRYLNPFPKNMREVLSSFKQILVPELNSGHLAMLLRARYLMDVKTLSKIQGKPFTIQEIVRGALLYLPSRKEEKLWTANQPQALHN